MHVGKNKIAGVEHKLRIQPGDELEVLCDCAAFGHAARRCGAARVRDLEDGLLSGHCGDVPLRYVEDGSVRKGAAFLSAATRSSRSATGPS